MSIVIYKPKSVAEVDGRIKGQMPIELKNKSINTRRTHVQQPAATIQSDHLLGSWNDMNINYMPLPSVHRRGRPESSSFAVCLSGSWLSCCPSPASLVTYFIIGYSVLHTFMELHRSLGRMAIHSAEEFKVVIGHTAQCQLPCQCNGSGGGADRTLMFSNCKYGMNL